MSLHWYFIQTAVQNQTVLYDNKCKLATAIQHSCVHTKPHIHLISFQMSVSLGDKLRPPKGGDIFVHRPIEQALELMVANKAEHPHVRTWKKTNS